MKSHLYLDISKVQIQTSFAFPILFNSRRHSERLSHWEIGLSTLSFINIPVSEGNGLRNPICADVY